MLAVNRVCTQARGCLPMQPPRGCHLGRLAAEVGSTADRVGSMLAAIHGGTVVGPNGCDASSSQAD